MACANAPPESTHITNSHNDTLVRIKQLHDEAHLYVGQGLSCDEQGQTEQAVTLYTKGLRCIDKALDLNNSLPQHEQKLQKQTDKMRITKQQVCVFLSDHITIYSSKSREGLVKRVWGRVMVRVKRVWANLCICICI